MRPARDVDIGPWRPGDEASICRLFRRTFGREKSVEEWRWEFLGPGLEPHVMLARDGDGEVVAHFGGVPHRARIGGRPAVFTVAVDSMVAPERRAGLKRRGLFAAVVERWIDRFCVHGPVEVGYGLANREALRIGRRLLGYTPLAGAALLARRLDAAPRPPSGAAGREVECRDAPADDHDALWERCAPRREVTACRDARFMHWRYGTCPVAGYSFLLVRRRGALTAAGVFKERYVVPDSATLVDLLWDGEDPDDLLACAAAAEERARDAGHHHLAVLLPGGFPEAAALRARGYRPAEMGLTLVGRSFRAAIDLAWLAPRFAFTCGDFDLV